MTATLRPRDNEAFRFPVSVKGVVVRNGSVVLLRNERDEWELPGGKLEPGEAPDACVVREIAEELDLARMVFVNMLDRERADFFRTLDGLKAAFGAHVVATEIPIGSEHELKGVVDLLHMCAYMDPSGGKEGGPAEIPADMADQVQEYREKLLDAVVETNEELMARYLWARARGRAPWEDAG